MLNNPEVEDCWEIEQGVHYSENHCLSFWRETICASEFVFDITENGYKIPFRITPTAYSIENRSSAKRRDSFVRAAISELLARGCVREVANYPEFCNPLHVVVQSSGKS